MRAGADNVARESPPFAGMRVLVLGLGRFGGGVGVTRWLREQGARVTVSDSADRASLVESVEAIAPLDITLHLGGHDPADLRSVDLAVVNPAVVKNVSPIFQELVHRGIAWTTEMNLFCERCPASVIGVTGSYGKSTTCAMLAGALQACFHAEIRRVYLGGNIGHSLLGDLEHMQPDDRVVLEMSNAQLEDLPRIDWVPSVAVINNIWPHHIDRHLSFDGYMAAKFNLLGDGRREQRAIVGELAPEAEARLKHFGGREKLRVRRVAPPIPPVELTVPGAHNRVNAATVLTVCDVLGVPEPIVRDSLRSFSGLPHRLQWVRCLDGVDYFNDSKSTSPRNTLAAIASLSRSIVGLVGGQRKDVDLTEWARGVSSTCRCVVCFGEAGSRFAAALRNAGRSGGDPQVVLVDRLADAVSAARSAAGPGDAVLFSPGAPSFDAYHNYAERGDHFVRLIRAI